MAEGTDRSSIGRYTGAVPRSTNNYDAVTRTLECMGMKELYSAAFKAKNMEDAAVEACCSPNSSTVQMLSQVIPIRDHRIQFIQTFSTIIRTTDTVNKPQPSKSPDYNTGSPDYLQQMKYQQTNGTGTPAKEDLINEAVTNYDKYMEELTNRASLIEAQEFKNRASREKQRILEMFRMNPINVRLDTQRLVNMIESLEAQLERSFIHNFRLFQKQKQLDELNFFKALENVNKFYREEMEKRFSSAPNNYLEQFHSFSNQIKIQAINRCKMDIRLNENQEKQMVKAMKALHLEYEERNLMRIPQSSVAIGIDLGTTYSCVGVCQDGKVTIIRNELGSTTTPSYVAFNEDGSVDVGDAAKYNADPQNCVFDAKRLIGRKFSDKQVQDDMKLWPFKITNPDSNDTPKIECNGNSYFPEQISARVLLKMKSIAESHLNTKVQNAVVTVPAYFNDAQRQATLNAGEIAGLNILKIINEPNAAAIAYKLHRTDTLKKNVLIFDLGGGTFDVAVLEMAEGEIKVKAVGGDTHLGGQDFDNQMIQYCMTSFRNQYGIDLNNEPSASIRSRCLRRIKGECEIQKRLLSSTNRSVIRLDALYKGHNLDLPITREQFEQINKPRFDRCIEIVDEVLKDARLKKKQIDDIVLVGGSTRIPKIQETLSEFFEGKALTAQLNADEAVAYGASIQAAILNGKQAGGFVTRNLVTNDVVGMSLGVRDGATGRLNVIIPRNTPIPHEVTVGGITVSNGQTTVFCEVFEGEDREVADNNHLLGEFMLTNIPPAPVGDEMIEVTMRYNDEGILRVSAVVLSNGSSNSITIPALVGRLSKAQIDSFRLDN